MNRILLGKIKAMGLWLMRSGFHVNFYSVETGKHLLTWFPRTKSWIAGEHSGKVKGMMAAARMAKKVEAQRQALTPA